MYQITIIVCRRLWYMTKFTQIARQIGNRHAFAVWLILPFIRHTADNRIKSVRKISAVCYSIIPFPRKNYKRKAQKRQNILQNSQIPQDIAFPVITPQNMVSPQAIGGVIHRSAASAQGANPALQLRRDHPTQTKKSSFRRTRILWSGLRGSNSLPPPWQGGALPDELKPQKWCLRSESNQWHGDFQSPALPTELQRQIWRPGTGSNRRPLAWQASVLTNWTTRPYIKRMTSILFDMWWKQ